LANEPQLQVATILSRPFEENTYVAHLHGRIDCVVIDPGTEPDQILEYLEEQGLTPAAILNTHGHADHIAGNGTLKLRWPKCPLVIGRDEATKLTDPEENLSAQFGLPIVSPPADVLVAEGDTYSAAGLDFAVQKIPGHSTGHVVFIWHAGNPTIVFGGDVLFAGSVGRCDFPNGSFEQLASGIHEKLFTLPDDAIVLSGHGPPTTIGEEKQTNPFVGAPAGWQPK
jgi:glyoxylase-like metal-dependent hydrolase (beta-lactamase superfamily II)